MALIAEFSLIPLLPHIADDILATIIDGDMLYSDLLFATVSQLMKHFDLGRGSPRSLGEHRLELFHALDRFSGDHHPTHLHAEDMIGDNLGGQHCFKSVSRLDLNHRPTDEVECVAVHLSHFSTHANELEHQSIYEPAVVGAERTLHQIFIYVEPAVLNAKDKTFGRLSIVTGDAATF